VKDLYAILGVSRGASGDEIKRAYRKLAMQHHPDRGGDQARFQEIQQAYDILSDPQRRQAHDNPQAQHMNFGFGGPGFQDIFSQMFGQNGFGPFQHTNQRRNHVRMELWIHLVDVAQGSRRTVTLSTPQGTQSVEIDIPLAINDGDHVQYPSLAPNQQDLVVTFRVYPDGTWTRAGLNLMTQCEIVIWDLILGGEVKIRDILGQELTVRIPPQTQPGTQLRLRGRGLRDRAGNSGDILVALIPRLPRNIPETLLEAIRNNRTE
jgi:DnaJ-class molecular chaperone